MKAASPWQHYPTIGRPVVAKLRQSVKTPCVLPLEHVRKANEPQDQVFVRAPIDVISRFKQYCTETGFSYGEARDELMRKAGI